LHLLELMEHDTGLVFGLLLHVLGFIVLASLVVCDALAAAVPCIWFGS
jgi:hypothetical protein